MPGGVFNPFENVRAAGRRSNNGASEAAADALNDGPRPPTPPKVTQYKTPTAPGARVLHPAYRVNMPPAVVDPATVFGDVAAGGGKKVTAAEVLAGTRMSAMEAEINAKVEERAFLSVRREPLGRPYVSGDLDLAKTKAGGAGFAFGAKGAAASESAKAVVFPDGGDPADAAREEVYQRSHRSFPPGVQRRTAVLWGVAGVDPATARFGKPGASLEKNLVGKCLNPAEDTLKVDNRTVLVSRVVDHYRALEDHNLGETRGKHVTDKTKHPAVYGKAAQRAGAGEWGAADCLQGDYTTEEQATDADLSRAVSLGFRNAGMAADPTRRFGLPSIRTDVPKRDGGSVATTTDFGDGPSAAQLLFPGPYAGNGIGESDFTAPRPRAFLRSMFARVGYAMSDAEFEAIYARAAEHGAVTPRGAVSVQEFRDALNEVMAGRDAEEEPRWFSEALA